MIQHRVLEIEDTRWKAKELEEKARRLLDDDKKNKNGDGAGSSGSSSDKGNTDSGDSFCFIATAAYGSPMAEEIAVLHLFRDEFLMRSTGGKAFIAFYYLASPPIADFIAEHEILRTIVREGLVDPVASLVEHTVDLWAE